ncbi:maleylpyruvate isomerase N-terminal domain-containing protein [Micromonospora sp. NPDC005172]|uniref:maleylpyruvate isomerase N-terminal domain-containing protein n=1 Tax=Micromonospora sp. NPDC005172 TaxID=3156867 RepID=UPI0033A55E5C
MSDEARVVLSVLGGEVGALVAALSALPALAWERPTRCDPWRVRDVVGHVIVVLSRVPDMVAAPAPERAGTTAAAYYRADGRFSDDTNDERVRTAQRRAADPDPALLVRDLVDTGRTVVEVCREEPADRVVRTRHGDAMLLTDFLTTRLVEVGLHGLDVADAVPREPWLGPAATEHLLRLLFGPRWQVAVDATGDPITLLRRATGREPVTAEQRRVLDQLGLRHLALG